MKGHQETIQSIVDGLFMSQVKAARLKHELNQAYKVLGTTSKYTTNIPDPDDPMQVLEWYRRGV